MNILCMLTFHSWVEHACGTHLHRRCTRCHRLEQEGITPFFNFWFETIKGNCNKFPKDGWWIKL